VKTILGGRVIAEWADDSPGMRPVGDPLGRYLPRGLSGPDARFEIFGRRGVGRRPAVDGSEFRRPGFSEETRRYSGVREGLEDPVG
jgi:dihydropyrimidinase/dihydroorotase